MRMNDRLAATNAFYRATGHVAPSAPFPAIITGVAMPQFQSEGRLSPSAPLMNPYPPCVDPLAADESIDTPNPNGFYPPQFLPCGVKFPRYRWKAVHSPMSSEAFGIRRTSQGKFKAWRQANFAVNVFEFLADQKLNYPFVPLGTNVIMAFGPIGAVIDNPDDPDNIAPATKWGFFFSHTSDPEGTWRCPPQTVTTPPDPLGCCTLRDGQLGIIIDQFCETLGVCAGFNSPGVMLAEWAGDGVDCPAETCLGSGGNPGSNDCQPVGPPGFVGAVTGSIPTRLVTRNHKLGGCFDSVPSEGTPQLPQTTDTCWPTVP